jgi:zinc transport system ATP-binding protein
MTMSESAISIENLDFSYEKANVLENVTLEIKKGEFVGIIGPNGGGKTTLLKIIMGFLKPDSGKVTLFGAGNKQCRIGYVPQTNRLDKFFPITVLELVLMGLIPEAKWFGSFSQKNTEKGLEMLKKLGMEIHAEKTFGSLSGGLAQRALIARALIADPDLLLLDEPTASIDPETKQTIYELLEEIKGKKTVLMVTHDLKTASERVERIIVVEKTVSSLSTQEICQHFAIGLYHPPLRGKNK